jgi:hypothetical protein
MTNQPKYEITVDDAADYTVIDRILTDDLEGTVAALREQYAGDSRLIRAWIALNDGTDANGYAWVS